MNIFSCGHVPLYGVEVGESQLESVTAVFKYLAIFQFLKSGTYKTYLIKIKRTLWMGW